MTLTQYLRVLRQHWLIVLLLALLGVAAAAAYTSRQTPIYQADTQVFVSARSPSSGDSLSALSEGSTFSQQRVKSYATMATSSKVTGPIVTRLRLPYSAGELAGKIDAAPQLDTVLIDIKVSDPDPKLAQTIAAQVTDQLQAVVTDLEKPADGEATVKLTVTRPPVEPTAPVSPRVPLNLALGLLLGLGLGVGAAVLRDQLNTTLRGAADLEQLTGSVPLGVVPFDASAPKQPLVTADAFGGRAEAFRTLRTNLQFADVDNPPRVIAVTSALPDEGKTTTACNIALILAQSGARVVLVEGDLRKPAVSRYLGISNGAGLTNVLAGQHDLRDVVVGYERDLLAVLPSGPTPPNPSELLGSQQMRHLLDTLAEHYDVVIIDAPPLLPVTDAALIATAADGAILVVRHGRSRREEAERALKSLEAVSAKMLGTVLNFAPRKKGAGGYDGYGYGYGQPPAAETTTSLLDHSEPSAVPEQENRRGRRGRKKASLPPETVAARSASEPLDLSRAEAADQVRETWRGDGPNGSGGSGPNGTGGAGSGFGDLVSGRPGSGAPVTGALPQLKTPPSTPPTGPSPSVGGSPAGNGPSRRSGSAHATDVAPGGPSMSSPGGGVPPVAGPVGGYDHHDDWVAADMGWAPSPSDGWAPIAGSTGPRRPEAPGTGGISVFGGLSSTGPVPIVTAPATDGLAVISHVDGVEVSRTVHDVPGATTEGLRVDRLEVVEQPGEVPKELRLQGLPHDQRTREPAPRAVRWSSPDTAPSGLPLGAPTAGTPLSGIPAQATSRQRRTVDLRRSEPPVAGSSAPAEPRPAEQRWTEAHRAESDRAERGQGEPFPAEARPAERDWAEARPAEPNRSGSGWSERRQAEQRWAEHRRAENLLAEQQQPENPSAEIWSAEAWESATPVRETATRESAVPVRETATQESAAPVRDTAMRESAAPTRESVGQARGSAPTGRESSVPAQEAAEPVRGATPTRVTPGMPSPAVDPWAPPAESGTEVGAEVDAGVDAGVGLRRSGDGPGEPEPVVRLPRSKAPWRQAAWFDNHSGERPSDGARSRAETYGAAPHGAAPHGAARQGDTRSGANPYGAASSEANPAGPDPAGPDPAGANHPPDAAPYGTAGHSAPEADEADAGTWFRNTPEAGSAGDEYGYLHAGGYVQDSQDDASTDGQNPSPEAEFAEIPPLTVDLSAPDLDLLEDERELLIPPQAVMPHVPTGVPRHHRSRRSL
ncbi:polysaccharide biosynthesis tyrosine autokinase [Kineosporia succinea]|uniref:non-specific protein-tyrosine kinase n=1 Tax=Kineosporia succinea TaxID=84632 RepID=A0ABT9P5U9_9ACTN|nr:polysaccharide biosynthesis tyrosine autokinase [Kineosporia succinea]MDP9827565.1 capsular exopolysaccharide synthesis family protein [Kineosporia succinea]